MYAIYWIMFWIVGYTRAVNVMQCLDSFTMHVAMTMVPDSGQCHDTTRACVVPSNNPPLPIRTVGVAVFIVCDTSEAVTCFCRPCLFYTTLYSQYVCPAVITLQSFWKTIIYTFIWSMLWVCDLKKTYCEWVSELIYNRQSVDQSVLVSGAHLGPVTHFSFSLKFLLDIYGFVIL
jgi:hypothetical protein